MAKKPVTHLYSDLGAFNRLLLLIATFLNYPGVGSAELSPSSEQIHNALEAVQTHIQEMAHTVGIELTNYSVNTIRKDLVTLRRYGILGQQMYRWGYYLGTGAMTPEELQVMLQALRSQAQQQGDAQSRQVLRTLERRLKGLNLQADGVLFYPVRTQLDRTIVHTDPQEMMRQGQYRHTLFQQLEAIETAIIQGQLVEIYRHRTLYGSMSVGHLRVYPVQLIYAEIAWYLLYEYADNQHLAIERIDRFSDYFKLLDANGRGLSAQQSSLKAAHQLLTQGWGLYLGNVEEQRQEREQQCPLINVTVRFFEPVISFLLEGERRHPTQTIQKGSRQGQAYINYSISLPERSLNEFIRWVNRFMEHAMVITPTELVEKHQQSAQKLVEHYQGMSDTHLV